MAYDTTTSVTDNVTDNLAQYHNELKTAVDHVMSAAGFAAYANTQSITANKTLTDADYPIQTLTPDAARDVNLPAIAVTNHAFIITNGSASFTLTVKNASAATISKVAAGSTMLFVSDGDSWLVTEGAESFAAAVYANVQSITADKTLTDADYPIQTLTPDAARDVNLPAIADTNHAFIISNGSASFVLTVKNASAATISEVAASSTMLFVSDGNSWLVTGGAAAAVDYDQLHAEIA